VKILYLFQAEADDRINIGKILADAFGQIKQEGMLRLPGRRSPWVSLAAQKISRLFLNWLRRRW